MRRFTAKPAPLRGCRRCSPVRWRFAPVAKHGGAVSAARGFGIERTRLVQCGANRPTVRSTRFSAVVSGIRAKARTTNCRPICVKPPPSPQPWGNAWPGSAGWASQHEYCGTGSPPGLGAGGPSRIPGRPVHPTPWGATGGGAWRMAWDALVASCTAPFMLRSQARPRRMNSASARQNVLKYVAPMDPARKDDSEFIRRGRADSHARPCKASLPPGLGAGGPKRNDRTTQ